jgi:outer membrane immunogenic protein
MHRRLLAYASAIALVATSSSAIAADIPVKSPIAKAPPPAVFDWTGWYAGLNYGSGVARARGTTPNNSSTQFERVGDGYSVGVQGGYNWQLSPNWVAGVEGDINWLGIDRHSQDWSHVQGFGVKSDWYGTVRGRVGYSNGPTLFYVTGGAAFIDVTNRYDVLSTGQRASNSEVASGWTGGWGIETMLGGNWSAKTEYVYIDAGSNAVTNPAVGFDPTATFHNRFHVFRKGLNYRFGGPAPALPAYSWTGYYIGVNAGTAVSQTRAWTSADIGDTDIGDLGFTGGVQAGYNWQFTPNWVAGVEADIGFLGVDRTYANWSNTIVFGVDADWYGTVRGRLGRSTGPAFLYVTGGLAVVHLNNTNDQVITSTFARSETAVGWTIGGGIEAVLGNNWTAKTEYLYIDVGKHTVDSPSVGGAGIFDNRFHVFRVGLNYQFASGKAPVVTKY